MSEIIHFKQKIDRRFYIMWEVSCILISGLAAFLVFALADLINKTFAVIVGTLSWIVISALFLKFLKCDSSAREYGLDKRRLYLSQLLTKDEPIMELRTVKEIVITDKWHYNPWINEYSNPNIILVVAKNHKGGLCLNDPDAFLEVLKKYLPNIPVTYDLKDKKKEECQNEDNSQGN